MSDTYKIRNWEKFQHYKNRNPLWIKLYTDLLNDKHWFALSAEDSKILVMLWLLASKKDGILPQLSDIAFCLRTTEPIITETLTRLTNWVVKEDASSLLAGGYKSACLEESRGELELELELEESRPSSSTVKRKLTDEEFWEFLKASPAYRHVDFEREDGKMDVWLSLPKNKHRKKTRSFIVGWINKIEPPVNGQKAPSRSRATKVVL